MLLGPLILMDTEPQHRQWEVTVVHQAATPRKPTETALISTTFLLDSEGNEQNSLSKWTDGRTWPEVMAHRVSDSGRISESGRNTDSSGAGDSDNRDYA